MTDAEFRYEFTTIPEGMTMAEYRRLFRQPAPKGWFKRLLGIFWL